jgi:hypothetical protein
MKKEIDRDSYCSADEYDGGYCNLYHEPCDGFGCNCKDCKNRHRKHPTPEEYKQEYGEDVPDDMAVYVLFETAISSNWTAALYSDAKSMITKHPNFYSNIIVACTPFGKPDENWRPQ